MPPLPHCLTQPLPPSIDLAHSEDLPASGSNALPGSTLSPPGTAWPQELAVEDLRIATAPDPRQLLLSEPPPRDCPAQKA